MAPYAKAEATGWVLGRVTRLTAWMLPRIRYWLTAESTAPKVSTWKCAKKEFFTQALVKRFGGHSWVSFEKGLRCTKCPTVLKRYRLLTDLEVLSALPCTGAEAENQGCGHPLLRKVHYTHTIHGEYPNLQCCHCQDRLSGRCRSISRKLLYPREASGRTRRR